MNKEETAINYIQHLDAVNIETINICNLMSGHPECPIFDRYQKFGPCELSSEAIKTLLKELNAFGFQGRIGLHHYSEPLMDKRIYDLISMTRKLCPAGKINLWSNGHFLNKKNAVKLMDLGVYWLRLSAYSNEEYVKLSALTKELIKIYPHAKFDVIRQKLDGRKKIYQSAPINLKKTCIDSRDLLIINSRGDLQLCCMDYLCEYTFGNINDSSLIDILCKSNYLNMRADLIQGSRANYDLCSRCWS